ncbi:hypothetical protein LCGC14_1242690, partial [marine sediment metagenome]
MSRRRIPFSESPIEVRQAFQSIDDAITVIEASSVSITSIATEGSLLVKSSDTTSREYDEFAQGTSNQVLVSAGSGAVPVWTADLDGLTLLVVDNITINGAAITSDTGAISFGNENLTTTGSVGIGTVPSDKLHVVDTRAVHGSAAFWIQQTGASPGTAYGAIIEKTGASQTNVGGSFSATGATNNYGLIVSAGNVGIGTTTPTDKLEVAGNISATTTIVGTNIPSPTIDDQILISTAAGIAGWSTAGVNQVMASDGSGEVAWANKPFGYLIPANSAQY